MANVARFECTAWSTVLLAALLAAACGISAVGEAGAPPTSVIPDATTMTTDASQADGGADANTGVDAATSTKQCVTFANSIAPFTYDGDDGGYTLGPNGVALSIAPGKSARVFHTFEAPKLYAHTVVDVHVGLQWLSGSWGTNSNDYASLLQNYYGATRDMATSSRLEIAMAHNVIDMNVWAPIQTNYALGGMDIPGPDTHVVVDTRWASGNNGKVVVSSSPTNGVSSWMYSNIPTASTASTDKLTVVLGGSGVNTVPTMKVTFFDVCVTFDP
jgi:hypothetical protein